MNYLAHAFLSGNNEDIILGGFIADAVKGNPVKNYDGFVLQGIRIHRLIDDYTSHHPVFSSSRKRVNNKYSGVIVDMFYDHFLAINWHDYSKIPLKEFTSGIYKIVFKKYLILPAKIKKMLPFMMSSDWLASYADLTILQKNFEGLASRTQFNSGMEYAVDELKKNYDLYNLEFKDFFQDVMNYSKTILKENQ